MRPLLVVRVLVVALSAGAGLVAGAGRGPLPAALGAAGGAALGGLAVWLEWRAAGVAVEQLLWPALGAFFGLVAGLGVGAMIAAVLGTAWPAGIGLPAVLGAYVGAAAALRRRAALPPVSSVVAAPAPGHDLRKLVDTSVIIDGRIADVCQTGFIDGVLVVPRFVLGELQQIADSSDPLRRNRGRRGFEVLQRLQQDPRITVEVVDVDVPHVREVDRKLIELGKTLGAKILTNDYALNRLAELSGVAVLNVNELANALKPAVLPGESMPVHVLREGKEPGQGVAYLDDGTMVVVDHGRPHVGQTVDVTVTSVLQTSAGRMIFTRVRQEQPVAGPRSA